MPDTWSPPGWARLFAYLAGVAAFVMQPLLRWPPHFPFLALDCIVMIGVGPRAWEQMKDLVLGLAGKSPTPPSSGEQTGSE